MFMRMNISKRMRRTTGDAIIILISTGQKIIKRTNAYCRRILFAHLVFEESAVLDVHDDSSVNLVTNGQSLVHAIPAPALPLPRLCLSTYVVPTTPSEIDS
jgi:hypothetical protein